MNSPKILLEPRRAALLAGHDNVLDVVVRLQAPDMPAGPMPGRQPLHVAVVLDRSGSMNGRPLEEAKRCAEFVIEGLVAGDQASLVVFDDHVETLAALTSASNRETLRHMVRSIVSGGSTDLHGGWLRGAETLAPHTSANTLSRVILLSDGCANRGLTDTVAIAAQCAALADAGVTTSTYGLGRNFWEDLMIAMARAGRGNSYYGQTAEDLMDVFREELALLNAVCARRLELSLKAGDGVRLEMLNDYVRMGERTWCLPDLAFAGEAWALVRLYVSERKVDELRQGGPEALVRAELRYIDLGGEPRAVEAVSRGLPVLSPAAFYAVAENALVKRRAEELAAARIQRKARTAARRGDWEAAERLLEEVDNLGADNRWLRGIVSELRDLARQRDREGFAKEAAYSSSKLSTRLAATRENEDPEAAVAHFLRRKNAQGKGS
jgi:Ca-activated chloride channel family protein